MAEHQLVTIVNTDPTFRWTVATLLRSRGFDVETFDRSVSRADAIVASRPAVILVEATYGGALSTTALVERLRDGVSSRHVPIVVCSHDPRFLASYGEYLRGVGCRVLGRPFDGDRLAALVGELAGPALRVAQDNAQGLPATTAW